MKYVEVSFFHYMLGVFSIFMAAWAFSFVGVITRKVREVHFSLMMFHYGWFSTLILLTWIVIEFCFFKNPDKTLNDSSKTPRILNYNFDQYILLISLSIVNVLSMNLNTLAFQYEK